MQILNNVGINRCERRRLISELYLDQSVKVMGEADGRILKI